MFELIMTFCIAGRPCEVETVANFPQYDVGMHICELAKPGIERGVRAKVSDTTRVTFKCQEAVGAGQAEYEYEAPRQQDLDVLEQLAPRLLNEAQRYMRP